MVATSPDSRVRTGGVRRWLRAHRLAAIVAGAAVIAAVSAGTWTLSEYLAWSRWTAQADAIGAARSGAPGAEASLAFRYRGRTRFVTVRVDPAELARDRALDTAAIFAQPAVWRAAYLRSLVRSQSRSASVASMAEQLRRIRDSFGLDPDEYVELMACVVQDIPYGTARPSFDLPAQVLTSGRAVCVDKSVLLAALLLLEGYDSGVWTLEAQHHVAVAVRGSGDGFRGSGYVFLETTRRDYVGEVPPDYAAVEPGQPLPQLVVAGGARPYGADLETAFIVRQLALASSAARALEPYSRYAAQASGKWRACYAGLAREQVAASRLAARLDQAGDDRRRVYALLTR